MCVILMCCRVGSLVCIKYTATPEHYTYRHTLSLPDALPILLEPRDAEPGAPWAPPVERRSADEPRVRLAERIARRIGAWIGSETLPAHGRAIRPGDIMVLVQRRGPFVHELVAALKKERVDVAGVDRMMLTEQMAVKDLVELGRAVLLPADDLTLAEVLQGPLAGLRAEPRYDLLPDTRPSRGWE